ncbi:hypothetical protein H1D32_09465 [Anaerobacillus sp. CMMVII]|uniref:Ger(x)C family spore germination protein n=1 Tax=Anaerobacillus sp. CMMVII TaxID=2755588 RepID=UPI0021B6EF08|nr:hypothetical protein [Anaerobacillus sp. CMMVII]MCT8137963.1 hypothetical protein [Anaerobacillus sp. CMMVII]
MLHKLLLAIIAFCILLTGCAQQRIVEDLGFINSVSFDLNKSEDAEKEGVLVVTISMPQVAAAVESDRVVLTTTANTSKEGRSQLARQTELVLVSGQLRSVLFSDDLAERGFLDTIDTLKRDHTIGLNVKVIVVNGSGKELLMSEFPAHPRVGRYIYEMIEKEALTHVTVETSLYHFVRDYHDDGIDPMVPIIKKVRKKLLSMELGYLMVID